MLMNSRLDRLLQNILTQWNTTQHQEGTIYNQEHKSHKQQGEWKEPNTQTERSIWFHLHKAQKQAELMCGDRDLNCGYPGGGGQGG